MTTQTIPLAPGDTASVVMLPAGGGTVSITRADVVEVKPTPPAPVVSLFSAQSMWNARPVKPVLGTDTIPAAKQKPWVEVAAYASRIFRASPTDAPMKITVADIANQLDGGVVTIAHFPADVVAATGSDGHCEVLEADGTLHSLYQLRKTATGYAAQKYARTSASGTGFGTVANPDNVRAAGCSTAGGLLLASEYGMDMVPHVLAIGMDKTGIKAGPVFPATLEDYDGGYGGKFPMGTLFMLPPSFNAAALGRPELQAIARTLMAYGGRLVDATTDSMNIYGEIGSRWNQSMVDGKYTATFDPDMQAIKAALRPVTSVAGWLDRDGKPFTPTPHRSMNLLSMRGPWDGYNGSKTFGYYDAASDLLQAEATTDARTVRQLLWMHDEANRFEWKQQKWNLNPEPGVKYIVTAIGTGAITATLATSVNWKRTSSTPKLSPGQSAPFEWPKDPATVAEVFVDKPAGGAASIRLELVKA